MLFSSPLSQELRPSLLQPLLKSLPRPSPVRHRLSCPRVQSMPCHLSSSRLRDASRIRRKPARWRRLQKSFLRWRWRRWWRRCQSFRSEPWKDSVEQEFWNGVVIASNPVLVVIYLHNCVLEKENKKRSLQQKKLTEGTQYRLVS